MWHRLLLVAALAGALLAPVGAVSAAELAGPEGPVILTVTGNVERTNRGPFDENIDIFFEVQEATFDRAAAFDLRSLEALGMHQLKVKYPTWPAAYSFEGPLLRDVLAAAGATGKTVTAFALDGYAADIDLQDLKRFPVILALKRDGGYLGLGGHGPAWIVYPRDDYPELEATDDSTWVWGVYRLDVQ